METTLSGKSLSMTSLRVAPVVFLLCLFVLPNFSFAKTHVARENAVKAAFLYNFAKFSEWPPKTFKDGGRVVLCVLEDQQILDILGAIKGKRVKGKKLRVERLEPTDEMQKCHILFVGTSNKRDLEKVLKKLANQPVLTVSDTKGFALSGGMIGLVRSGNRIRFNINLDAVERSGITLSSKLLSLATIVNETVKE